MSTLRNLEESLRTFSHKKPDIDYSVEVHCSMNFYGNKYVICVFVIQRLTKAFSHIEYRPQLSISCCSLKI